MPHLDELNSLDELDFFFGPLQCAKEPVDPVAGKAIKAANTPLRRRSTVHRGGSIGASHAPRRQTRGRRGAGARVPPVDDRDERRLLSHPLPLLQHLDRLPQLCAVAPIFRDETRKPGDGKILGWLASF